MNMLEGLSLKGRNAIVTGGGSGIGKATSLILAQAGARVAVCDINYDKACRVKELIECTGSDALAIKCDVSDSKECEKMVDIVAKEFKSIDILVNNVGGGGGGREYFEELSDEYIEKIYNLNLFSIFRIVRLCLPYMPKSDNSSIVNVSSMSSIINSKDMSVYGTTKAAIVKLTRSMSVDLAPIRVNCVMPGAIKTPALENILNSEIETNMLKSTPLKRLGTPEDIASAIFFFVSSLASWISGQSLMINGGGIQDL